MIDVESRSAYIPFEPRGSYAISDKSDGSLVARHLSRSEGGVKFSPDAKYLAIGAGKALAEMELAKSLGIRTANITLIDNNFTHTTPDPNFTGTRIEEDVISFLESGRTDKFDLASAFAMDHVFGTDENLERLIAALSRNINLGGVVVLFPDAQNQGASPIWRKHGLISLYHGAANNPGICSKIKRY